MKTLCPGCARRRCLMKMWIARKLKTGWFEPECKDHVPTAEWEKFVASQAAAVPSTPAAGEDPALQPGTEEPSVEARPSHRKRRVAADQAGEAEEESPVRVLPKKRVSKVRAKRAATGKGGRSRGR